MPQRGLKSKRVYTSVACCFGVLHLRLLKYVSSSFYLERVRPGTRGIKRCTTPPLTHTTVGNRKSHTARYPFEHDTIEQVEQGPKPSPDGQNKDPCAIQPQCFRYNLWGLDGCYSVLLCFRCLQCRWVLLIVLVLYAGQRIAVARMQSEIGWPLWVCIQQFRGGREGGEVARKEARHRNICVVLPKCCLQDACSWKGEEGGWRGTTFQRITLKQKCSFTSGTCQPPSIQHMHRLNVQHILFKLLRDRHTDGRDLSGGPLQAQIYCGSIDSLQDHITAPSPVQVRADIL